MNKPNIKKEEILEAFNYRHATKVFDTNKKVSDDDFNFILETARLSPSSFGFEPWKFIVVQDTELRELLKPVSWGATEKLDTASHFILALSAKAPLMKWDSEYLQGFMKNIKHLPTEVTEMITSFYKKFQEEDFNLDTDRSIFDWSTKQNYIALANMMTSAAMIGVDSCPIEGFHQQDIEKILKEKFDVDTEKYGLSYMLAFGYRVDEPREKTRQSIENIVTWK